MASVCDRTHGRGELEHGRGGCTVRDDACPCHGDCTRSNSYLEQPLAVSVLACCQSHGAFRWIWDVRRMRDDLFPWTARTSVRAGIGAACAVLVRLGMPGANRPEG